MGKPTEKDMQDENSFRQYAAGQQTVQGGNGPQRTSASISGVPQYAATSFSVSDILQGSFAVNNQSDQLLVINKALTQDLKGLYTVGADAQTSFSSVPASGDAQGQMAGDAPGSIIVDSGAGGTLKETWVNSLPLEHPTTKAVLWVRSGKCSREMHIPVADNLAADVATHLQHADMPAEWKHPWNMDRVGGPIGGGTTIYTDVGAAGTILGEDASAAGQVSGAFGFLKPEEEEYYMSMAWPYKGGPPDAFRKANREDLATVAENTPKAAYQGKKILVYSKKTQKGCVCTPGDWGPQPYWSNGAETKVSINGFYSGLSPDVHWVLGTNHGDEFSFGWMADTTPLGPYTPKPNEGTANPGAPTDIPGASGGGGQNTIEELIIAGKKILAHPNCWMSSHRQLTAVLSTGQALNDHPDEVLYKDSTGKQFLFPSLLNYLWLILEGGFILDQYLGSIGHKQAAGNAARLSNHASGGAIDIGLIGLASEGKTYALTDTTNGRRLADTLFNYLATLTPTTRPEEIGAPFSYVYANGFNVYKDAHPTHLHIGFDLTEAGTLMRQLKGPDVNTRNG